MNPNKVYHLLKCPCDECLFCYRCRKSDFIRLIEDCGLLKDYLNLYAGMKTQLSDFEYPSKIVLVHEILNPTTWYLTMKKTNANLYSHIYFLLGEFSYPTLYSNIIGYCSYARVHKICHIELSVRINVKKYEHTKKKIIECLKKKKEKGYRTYGAGNIANYKRDTQC